MDKPVVLTTAALPAFLMEPLAAHFELLERLHVNDPARFAQMAPRVTGIAANGESKIPRELIAQMPALKVISVMGVGYDGVDTTAARERGVMVTHTPDVLNDDVADLAIGLMLSIARRIPQADQFVRAGRWPQGPMPLATKVSGARLGIIGLGRIGMAIAQRAQAFGMGIAYHSRNRRTDCAFDYHASAESLAGAVDFLVAITPGGAGTRKLVNAQVLRALGPKGYLINVARGSVVDEAALLEALRQGVIAGAALDVYEDEPRVPEGFWSLDNVVLTPHMASATRATRGAMADLAFRNLKAVLDGQSPVTPVPECRPAA